MMWAFSLTRSRVLSGRSPRFLRFVHLFDQDGRIDHDAVADDADLARVENAGRDEMQDGLFPSDDQGVAGVVAPLEAGDHIGIFRINIDDFPFSFVAPLGSHHHHVCHKNTSPKTSLPL